MGTPVREENDWHGSAIAATEHAGSDAAVHVDLTY